MSDEHHRKPGHLGNRQEIALEIEAYVFLETRQAHDIVVRAKQGVAVGRRLRDVLDSDL